MYLPCDWGNFQRFYQQVICVKWLCFFVYFFEGQSPESFSKMECQQPAPGITFTVAKLHLHNMGGSSTVAQWDLSEFYRLEKESGINSSVFPSEGSILGMGEHKTKQCKSLLLLHSIK